MTNAIRADAFISALAVYPVKSCRAIALESALLLETGFAADRQWLVVDPDGRFVSQRECPQLARISTAIEGERLILSAPDCLPLTISPGHGGQRMQVTIWRDTVAALDEGDVAANWFSARLNQTVRLVRFDSSETRFCDRIFAGDGGAHTLFSDGFPLLVVNEASLAELNAQMAQYLPMTRFRPNIVLAGLDPFAEDHIDAIHIGHVSLRLVKPCTRCKITTTDQETGDVGIEPLPTLARMRHDPKLGGVTFGINAIVTRGVGERLQRGAAVEIDWRF